MAGRFDRVFVAYPRGVRTGGPEALHQLVHDLRLLGQEAYLVPLPGSEESPRVRAYRRYDAPEARRRRPGPRDAVVYPEVCVDEVLRPHRGALVHLWWLSLDNSPLFRPTTTRANRRLAGEPVARVDREVLAAWRRRRALVPAMREVTHLVHSDYARAAVESWLKVSTTRVGDYVTPVEIGGRERRTDRRPVITFNPRKAHPFAAQVRERLGPENARWLGIRDLTPREVAQALHRSTVYLELGHQPGRDRLPREAALLGTPVIVARRGGGARDADMPLPAAYRPASDDLVGNTVAALRTVLADPAAAVAAQQGFRGWVAGERATFQREVAVAFGLPTPALGEQHRDHDDHRDRAQSRHEDGVAGQ